MADLSQNDMSMHQKSQLDDSRSLNISQSAIGKSTARKSISYKNIQPRYLQSYN